MFMLIYGSSYVPHSSVRFLHGFFVWRRDKQDEYRSLASQGLSVTVIPSSVKLAGRQLHISNDSKLCRHSESNFSLCFVHLKLVAGDN